MKQLAYISFLILLAVTRVTAQGDDDLYVIDIVCQGSERYYRVNGENGSAWKWLLTDSAHNPLPLDNEEGTYFTGQDTLGNQIQGSEIRVIWDYPQGTYYLSVEQTSEFGCDTLARGYINIIEGPDAFEDRPRVHQHH